MNRGSKSSRRGRGRGGSKNPPPPPSQSTPPSQSPPQPSSSDPPRLLPPSLEIYWKADEIWALMSHAEKSYAARQFEDTPAYWSNTAQFFPNCTAGKLRLMHMDLVRFQNNAVIWKQHEIQTLISFVFENLGEAIDTPEWWLYVASHVKGRSALDCRIAYNSYGSSRIPTNDAASTSSTQRNSEVSLENWTLDEYIFLMKILSRDLHVDTEDAGKMESMASLMVGKRGEEVRHLILKWRPQLLAALEKADRITGSGSESESQSDDDGSDDDGASERPPQVFYQVPSWALRSLRGGRR